MFFFQSKYNYYYKINPKYTFINNNLTGAVDIIESVYWDFLIQENYEKIPNAILNKLFERGYIYKNKDDEKYISKKLFKSFLKKSNNKIKRFVFVPTFFCNLSCIYCFEKKVNNRKAIFNIELLNSAFSVIKKLSKNDDYKIELYGGEPLLPATKNIIKNIVDRSALNKHEITIITNGIYIKSFLNIINKLSKNLEMIQITLDGISLINDNRRKFKSGKGTFKIISKNVSSLISNNINVCLRINIDINNIVRLPELHNYVSKNGWLEKQNFDMKLSLVTNHECQTDNLSQHREEKILEQLINIYNKYPDLEKDFKFYAFKQLRNIFNILDGANNNSPKFFNCEANIIEYIIFCPDGYIYTCPESIGIKKYAIGIFYPKFLLFENNKNQWITRNVLNIPDCKICKFAPICGGGCNYASLQQEDNSIPVCERFEHVLDTFFQLRGEKILSDLNLNY